MTSREFIRLSQMANVGSALVRRNTSFLEQVVRALNYSYTFVEDYRLPGPRAKTADNVQDMVPLNTLYGMDSSTYRQYMGVE